MRRNALEPNDDEMEYGDYLCDERRAEKRERQAEMFSKPLAQDMYVLLQLFENYRGIDIRQDFTGLHHVYHSVYTNPGKLPKSSWSEARVLNAIEACEAAGLIADVGYNPGVWWEITKAGAEARKAETLRRMRG